MVEDEVRRGFGPLLAVLSTERVEESVAKNNLSFAELLVPFCSVECDLKDPSGISTSSRVVFDVRDVRREGFLLSLTVLPSVLHETVRSIASTSDATSVFREALLRWAEPAEHEFLRTYIACLFAISSEDDDPLNQLSQLIQSQHSQQHGGSSTATIGPAYCVHPKWMLPNTYKYHILVHDVSTGNESRTQEIFDSMCSVYGAENCHLLRLNSGADDNLEDFWKPELARKNYGLESGLARARKNILSKASASLGTESIADANAKDAISNSISQQYRGLGRSGCYLTISDREAISSMMKDFNSRSLTPFIERQLRTMNEQITARRGISRSLTTGVRKWFGAATVQSNSAAAVSYSLESSEMQTRRLADLCFVFGLYAYAHQLYQGLKKTFAIDQAWLYHAGALEMAAMTAFLSNIQIQPKQYPQHYMENALNYYATTCMRPILAMRAALMSDLILCELGLHSEAAGQLLKLTSLDNDLFGGVLLERVSMAFGNAKMQRKMAFHYVLAGHRFFKAEQEKLALGCYKLAFSQYNKKCWLFAEDHILYTLARDYDSNEDALKYCLQLFRPTSVQNEEQQHHFLTRLLELLATVQNSNGLPLVLPVSIIRARVVHVVYGGYSHQALPELVAEPVDEEYVLPNWNSMERVAFQFFFGGSSKFIAVPAVTGPSADYSVVRCVPLNEQFRVKLALKSFLGFGVSLKRVHLSVNGDCSALEISTINEVALECGDDWVEVELGIVARQQCAEFHIRGLSFDFEHGGILLYCQTLIESEPAGIGFHSEAAATAGKECCISAKVVSLLYPLIRIDLAPTRHVNAFCGQIYCVDFELVNDGAVAVQDLCMMTNRPTMVSLCEWRCSNDGTIGSWDLCEYHISSSDRNILFFRPKMEAFAVGSKKKLRLAFRAPQKEVKNFPLSLMFYYSGDNGMCRQERHLISIVTHRLLNTSLSIINDVGDLCSLNVRNLVSVRDSLLAKVELLGIRCIKNAQKTSKLGLECSILLKPVRRRAVRLEREQSDIICFTANMGMDAISGSIVWLSSPVQDFPDWPVIAAPASRSASASTVQILAPEKNSYQFGVMWKANIVNTDGTVANVFGEDFVEYFYRPEATATLPDSLSSLSLFEKTVSNSRMDQVFSSGTEGPDNSQYLICSLKCATSAITHDFSKERLCQFPVDIGVTNNDRLQRDCDLVLRCIAPGESSSFSGASASRRDENGTISSMVSLAPSVGSTQFLPSTTQPLIIANCARTHAHLACGSTHVFKLYLSVAAASVYNITCFELSAQFRGTAQSVRVALPYTFVAVVDKRAKGKR